MSIRKTTFFEARIDSQRLFAIRVRIANLRANRPTKLCLKLPLLRANGSGGFGSQTAADPLETSNNPSPRHSGNCGDTSQRMLTTRALLSPLASDTATEEHSESVLLVFSSVRVLPQNLFVGCFFRRVGAFLAQKRSQKFKVMKFENFESEICGGFFGGKISCLFPPPPPPGNIGLKFVTETSRHSSHRSSQEAKKFVISCSVWRQSLT